MDSAAPKVEKAAGRAGKLLGTLRERAKETAKGFSEGLAGTGEDEPTGSADTAESADDGRARRPKPGPR
jgi:hypothetical protein